MSRPAPVVAEVVRNGFVESRHHGHVVAQAADGKVVMDVGDTAAPVLPRSSLKPLQAFAFLRSGWQPHDDEQIALATASHSGEARHVAVVRRILAGAGLDESHLQNTPDLPLHIPSAHALLRAGGEADRSHQNCSGKHAAMLATCVANGWSVDDYLDVDHPVQVAARAATEDLCGEHVSAVAVDGCGAPAFAVSLRGLARAFTRLVHSDVARAMRGHPDLVGGSGRDVTSLMLSVPGMIAKDGAEGVYAAALDDGSSVAIKIADGAGRARTPVLIEALVALGLDPSPLTELRTTRVLGHGVPVGQVRAIPLPPNR